MPARTDLALAIAARSANAMRIDTLEDGSAADPIQWARERIDAIGAEGARGPLYVFIRRPPDRPLADLLRAVTARGRLQPNVVAAPTAITSGAHLELLQYAGARTLYFTLHGAAAG